MPQQSLTECGHGACHCLVGPGVKFCSEYCAEQSGENTRGVVQQETQAHSHDHCDCGHTECAHGAQQLAVAKKDAGSKIEATKQTPTAPGDKGHAEWLVDESVEESFPASDPPSSITPGSTASKRANEEKPR